MSLFKIKVRDEFFSELQIFTQQVRKPMSNQSPLIWRPIREQLWKLRPHHQPIPAKRSCHRLSHRNMATLAVCLSCWTTTAWLGHHVAQQAAVAAMSQWPRPSCLHQGPPAPPPALEGLHPTQTAGTPSCMRTAHSAGGQKGGAASAASAASAGGTGGEVETPFWPGGGTATPEARVIDPPPLWKSTGARGAEARGAKPETGPLSWA